MRYVVAFDKDAGEWVVIQRSAGTTAGYVWTIVARFPDQRSAQLWVHEQ